MKRSRKSKGVVHETWHLPDLRRPVDLATLHKPGTYLNTEESATHKLARAIHYSESGGCCISWSAQERAQAFINANGLAAALTEAFRLEALPSLEEVAPE